VRRLGGGQRDVPLAGQLDLDLQRRLPDDDELGAQVGCDRGDRLGQRAGRDRGSLNRHDCGEKPAENGG
jgi:hypothetical protein